MAPERIRHYNMKLLSNARVNSMQAQIRVQALAVKFLEEENRKQAERIAGLEALLFCQGVLDKDAALASKEERAWFASLRLERYAGTETPSAGDAGTPKTLREGGKDGGAE